MINLLWGHSRNIESKRYLVTVAVDGALGVIVLDSGILALRPVKKKF